MATYFVEINAHFLVKIELDGSCCAAEHHFLDNYAWVWGANAYDEKSMKTECFRGALLTSELVSEQELAQRLVEVEKARDTMDSFEDEFQAAKAEVERLERQLDDAKARLMTATSNRVISIANFESICKDNHAKRPQ